MESITGQPQDDGEAVPKQPDLPRTYEFYRETLFPFCWRRRQGRAVTSTRQICSCLRNSARACQEVIMVTLGFTGPYDSTASRTPPGQQVVRDFPILTVGPPRRISTADPGFTLKLGRRPVRPGNWSGFNELPQTKIMRDIHRVNDWFKPRPSGRGDHRRHLDARAEYVLALCFDRYSTNVPLVDLASDKATVAQKHGDQPASRARWPRAAAGCASGRLGACLCNAAPNSSLVYVLLISSANGVVISQGSVWLGS
jgi:hypothetical protein